MSQSTQCLWSVVPLAFLFIFVPPRYLPSPQCPWWFSPPSPSSSPPCQARAPRKIMIMIIMITTLLLNKSDKDYDNVFSRAHPCHWHNALWQWNGENQPYNLAPSIFCSHFLGKPSVTDLRKKMGFFPNPLDPPPSTLRRKWQKKMCTRSHILDPFLWAIIHPPRPVLRLTRWF